MVGARGIGPRTFGVSNRRSANELCARYLSASRFINCAYLRAVSSMMSRDRLLMVGAEGLEPTTSGVWNRCSAAELRTCTIVASHRLRRKVSRRASADLPTAHFKIGAASTQTPSRMTMPATKCGATTRTNWSEWSDSNRRSPRSERGSFATGPHSVIWCPRPESNRVRRR